MKEFQETELIRLGREGYKVMSSDLVKPGTMFAFTDPAALGTHQLNDVLVVHPLDYNYLNYSNDPFRAHELNMAIIHDRIDRMYEDAIDRIDKMVDMMNAKYEPRVVEFLYGAEVTENPDGSFSFYAKSMDKPTPSWDELIKGDA